MVTVRVRVRVRFTCKNADDKGGNDSSNCLDTTLKYGVTPGKPQPNQANQSSEKMVFKTIMVTTNRNLSFGVIFDIIASSFNQYHPSHEGRKRNEFHSIVMKQSAWETGT